MKGLLHFSFIVLTGILGGGVWSACKVADDTQPPVNKACQVARRMALPNLECDPVATSMGWFPDTCICQLATKAGETRVPTQVIWVKASLTDPPEVKSVYSVPPPIPTQPQPPKQPELRKE